MVWNGQDHKIFNLLSFLRNGQSNHGAKGQRRFDQDNGGSYLLAPLWRSGSKDKGPELFHIGVDDHTLEFLLMMNPKIRLIASSRFFNWTWLKTCCWNNCSLLHIELFLRNKFIQRFGTDKISSILLFTWACVSKGRIARIHQAQAGPEGSRQ